MKLIGAIGLLASGKDAVIDYISLSYGLPMVSSGDITREIAILEGRPLTRECLTEIASTNMSVAPDWYPKEVLRRILENGWDTAAITGIRTYADIMTYRGAVGDDFVCFHVEVSDPKVRLQRVRLRKESRDPKTIEELLEHDALEMRVFGLNESIPLADVTINNDGTIQETEAQVDYHVRRLGIVTRPKSRYRYWFLVGLGIGGVIRDRIIGRLHAKLGESLVVPMDARLGNESQHTDTSGPKVSLDADAGCKQRSEQPAEGEASILLRRAVQALPRAEYLCVLGSDPLVCLSSAFKAVVGVGRDNLAMVFIDTCLGTCDATGDRRYSNSGNWMKATDWSFLSAIANPSYIVIHNPHEDTTLTIDCPVSSEQREVDFRALSEVSFGTGRLLSAELSEIASAGASKACVFVRIDRLEDVLIGSDASADRRLAGTIRQVQQHCRITSVTFCGHAFEGSLTDSSEYAELAALIEEVLRIVVYV